MLNEKGLAAVMKEAWRGAGYTVAERQGNIMIRTGYTAVTYPTRRLPRKCLGLIAEHVGEIPEGMAYRVNKKDGAQSKLLDEELAWWGKYHEDGESLLLSNILPTAVKVSGMALWQSRIGGRVVAVDPAYSRIIEPDMLGAAEWTGNLEDGLIWLDGEGIAVVVPRTRGENDTLLDHLDGFPLTGE